MSAEGQELSHRIGRQQMHSDRLQKLHSDWRFVRSLGSDGTTTEGQPRKWQQDEEKTA
jgi:hypothetical protein